MNGNAAIPRDSARDPSMMRGGRIPGIAERPAFELLTHEPPPVPILIAAPHGGRSYPADLLDTMRNPAQASLRLEDRYIDMVAASVARQTGAALLVAHAPRAMIDLNRAPDDMDWSMVADLSADAALAAIAAAGGRTASRRARSGLGLVPRRLPGMGELWKTRIGAAALAERIEQVHRPYHQALGKTLEHLRDRWGAALLLDLHSMPPLGPKRGADSAPDFVLGDRFGASCSSALGGLAMEHFLQSRRIAAHNRPYAGSYVLDRHAAPARGIHAIQVETCRAAYLDGPMREPGSGFAGVVHVLAGLVRRLADELSGLQALAQAAE